MTGSRSKMAAHPIGAALFSRSRRG